MQRTSVGQKARKWAGLRAESLVKSVLEDDPKVKRKYRVVMSYSRGKVPGLDVHLRPNKDVCDIDPDSAACKPVEMEVKSVEKLFEEDNTVDWPHNRVSRYVLKPDEQPACYVFVTNDDLSNHTVVDMIDSTYIGKWMEKLRHGKSPKLPVRALPLLRKHPCKHVARPLVIVPKAK
jgi:hypothetical protein